MKSILFLLSLLSFSLITAQPVITNANYPNAGESYSGFYDLPTWNPGASGPGQTWDFSTLGGTGTTIAYESPSSTAYASSFTTSNIALSQLGSYLFYNSSSSSLEVTGTVSQFTVPANVRPFSNNQEIITFPFTYNDEIKDTATTGIINRPNDAFGAPTGTQKRVVYSHTLADGYGSITLPGSVSFSNVLRIRITTETIDSTWNTSNVFSTESISIDTQYYFISENQKPHVLVLGKNVSGATETIIAQYITSPSLPTSVIVSSNAYLKIYPNPATSIINFEVTENLSANGQLSLQLFDSKGGLVSGFNNLKFINGSYSLSGLQKGIYFYQLKDNTSLIDSGKIIIE